MTDPFKHLLQRIEGVAALVVIDTLSAFRTTLHGLKKTKSFDEVEEGLFDDLLFALNRLLDRFSQRKIREAHQLLPQRVERVAQEQGLTSVLEAAKEQAPIVPGDKGKIN